jgi:hypothetical protein
VTLQVLKCQRIQANKPTLMIARRACAESGIPDRFKVIGTFDFGGSFGRL